ncbi:uncharacterized protein LOC34617818 [Cyclospora cayetanensis]|uniref:Uncharacterized protein LOC34617818 n=1 Tax=Cyclospora cayetanensis TaxID=88456 RepID=A0A6P6S271_9EIME|nr:uncharacterized protein LOC34617818 [Cyclospora cayetanensis]
MSLCRLSRCIGRRSTSICCLLAAILGSILSVEGLSSSSSGIAISSLSHHESHSTISADAVASQVTTEPAIISTLEEESGRSVAVSALKETLEKAIKDSVSAEPDSREFQDAVKNYRETGICASWIDPKTNKVTPGISEDLLAKSVQERKTEGKVDIEDLSDALKSHDPKAIVTVACVKRWRKVCCCMEEKQREIKWAFVLFTVILGGTLAAGCVYMLLHGQTKVHMAVNALGSSGCAALGIVETATLGGTISVTNGEPQYAGSTLLLPGLMSKSDDNAIKFPGVSGLEKNAKGLEALFNTDGPNNLSTVLKSVSTRGPELDERLQNIKTTNMALTTNLDSFKKATEKAYMKYLFWDAVKTLGDDYYSPFEKAVEGVESAANSAMNKVSLPSLNLKGGLDLEKLQEETKRLQEVAVDAAHVATPMAALAPIVLWGEVILIFLGVVFGAIALALFFFSKGRSGLLPSCLSWNCVLALVSLSVITTGAVFMASYVGDPICTAGVKSLWPAGTHGGGNTEDDQDTREQLDRLMHTLVGENGGILQDCLQNENLNILEAMKEDHRVEEAKKSLGKARNTVLSHLPDSKTEAAASTWFDLACPMLRLPAFNPFSLVSEPMCPRLKALGLKYVEKMQNWINEFGFAVIFDREKLKSNPETKDLVDTFPEVLNSGLQWDNRTVHHPGYDEPVTVYGLHTLRRIIEPAGMKGYESIGNTLTITSTYPTATDEEFKKWLENLYNEKVSGGTKFDRLKPKMLNSAASQLCASSSSQEKFKKENNDSEEGAKAKAEDYIKKLRNAILLCKYKLQLLEETMDCYRNTSAEDVEKGTCTGREMIYIDNFKEACNCGFVRRDMIELTYLGCNNGADAIWTAAIVRFLGQLFALALGVLLFIIWRIQKDNGVAKKEENKESEFLIRSEGERPEEVFVDTADKESDDKEQPVSGSPSMWA